MLFFYLYLRLYYWAGVFVSTDDRCAITHTGRDTLVISCRKFCVFLHVLVAILLVIRGGRLCTLFELQTVVTDPAVYWQNWLFGLCIGRFHKYSFTLPHLSGPLFVTWVPWTFQSLPFSITRLTKRVFRPALTSDLLFLLSAVYTPIILAFERHKQDKALAEIVASVKARLTQLIYSSQISSLFY